MKGFFFWQAIMKKHNRRLGNSGLLSLPQISMCDMVQIGEVLWVTWTLCFNSSSKLLFMSLGKWLKGNSVLYLAVQMCPPSNSFSVMICESDWWRLCSLFIQLELYNQSSWHIWEVALYSITLSTQRLEMKINYISSGVVEKTKALLTALWQILHSLVCLWSWLARTVHIVSGSLKEIGTGPMPYCPFLPQYQCFKSCVESAT